MFVFRQYYICFSADVLSLSSYKKWQKEAQHKKGAAALAAQRKALWRKHKELMTRQQAFIDELLYEPLDQVPSAAEIRQQLKQYIPYDEKLSDDIVAVRYGEE